MLRTHYLNFSCTCRGCVCDYIKIELFPRILRTKFHKDEAFSLSLYYEVVDYF